MSPPNEPYQCSKCGETYGSLEELEDLWLSEEIQVFNCVNTDGILPWACGGLVHGRDHSRSSARQ